MVIESVVKVVSCIISLLLLLLSIAGCSGDANTEGKVEQGAASGTVSLLIDSTIDSDESDDKQKRRFAVVWKSDATAFNILKAAGVEVESTGSGETCFVTAIDNLANEGSGGANWVFSVNGKTGTKSCDATSVNPGDEVQWTLGDYKIE